MGCGTGRLHDHVRSEFSRCFGIEVVKYEGFPEETEFCQLDLDSDRLPLPYDSAELALPSRSSSTWKTHGICEEARSTGEAGRLGAGYNTAFSDESFDDIL
jgi:hypothetical protein